LCHDVEAARCAACIHAWVNRGKPNLESLQLRQYCRPQTWDRLPPDSVQDIFYKKTQITGEVAACLEFHTPFSVCRHVLSPVFVEHWMGFEITNRPPSSTVILRLLLLLFPQLLPMATAFASFTSIASHSSSCLITRRRVPVRVWDPQVQYTIVKLRCCCCCCFFFFFFFFWLFFRKIQKFQK
jgi:hypothetical protein